MGSFNNGFPATPRSTALDGTQVYPIISHYNQITPVTITNTVAETTIFGSGTGSRTFGPGFFNVGSIVRVRILGSVQVASATESLRVRAYLGATPIFDSGAFTPPNLATPTEYRRDIDFSFSSVGATGSCSAGSAELVYSSTPGTVGDSTAPTISTIDTTVSEALNITYTWGAASASNIIKVYGIIIECIG